MGKETATTGGSGGAGKLLLRIHSPGWYYSFCHIFAALLPKFAMFYQNLHHFEKIFSIQWNTKEYP
jgi:hypothetical protein